MGQVSDKGIGWRALLVGVVALLAALIALCIVMPNAAEAATPSMKPIVKAGLENYDAKAHSKSKTVSKYDVTNDGKKDKVKVKLSSKKGSYTITAAVYVNGKKVFSKGGIYEGGSCSVQQITLKNGKKFVYIQIGSHSDDSNFTGIFKYSKGKLKACGTSNLKGAHYSDITVKVSGNSVKATYHCQPYRVGITEFAFTYKYKKGTLKRSSTTSSVGIYKRYAGYTKGYFTTSHKIKARAAASDKAKAKTLKKNTQVMVTKVALKGNTLWFKMVSKSGATYWVKNISKPCVEVKYPLNACIKEAQFAG